MFMRAFYEVSAVGPRARRHLPGDYTSRMQPLREQLAAVAARLIVEDGLDYATARRKAAHQVLGHGTARPEQLPDNDLLREHVAQYLAVFHGDAHPELLWRMRRAALGLMEEFAEFHPYLAGAIWNGTATAHSGVHVLLFTDDTKAVDIHCIDRNIAYKASQAPHYAGRQPVDRLAFEWPTPDGPIEASLSLYPLKDERGVLTHGTRGRGAERGSIAAVRALVQAGPQPSRDGSAGPNTM